jgi:cytochrome c oxidase subunit 3
VYRSWYPAEFEAGSDTMDVVLGTSNTGLLLTSSLTMALAVHAADSTDRKNILRRCSRGCRRSSTCIS